MICELLHTTPSNLTKQDRTTKNVFNRAIVVKLMRERGMMDKVLDRYWINVWIQDCKFITTFCIKKGLVNIGVNVTGSNGHNHIKTVNR